MLRFFALAAFISLQIACVAEYVEPGDAVDMFPTLVWSDEFDGANGSAPDSAKWSRKQNLNVNGELQGYTGSSANSYLNGTGQLVISAIKQSFTDGTGTYNYTSARLETENKFEFMHGRVETRVKVPTVLGVLPAFWLIGENWWPAPWPACGEIDIVEWPASEPGKVYASLHSPGNNGNNSRRVETSAGDLSTAWHTYSIEWHSNKMYFFMDGAKYGTIPANADWPFNHNFFIILNLAVGFWGGTPNPATAQWDMIVDYVRVYQ